MDRKIDIDFVTYEVIKHKIWQIKKHSPEYVDRNRLNCG